jgi:hypothetical protein
MRETFGILLVAGIGVIGYSLYSIHVDLSRATAFEAQARCAERSAEFFNDGEHAKQNGATYRPYYNPGLNKCFVLIETAASEPDQKDLASADRNRYFFDVLDARGLGFIQWDPKQHKWLCTVNIPPGHHQFCNSPSSFDNLIRPYMP